MPSEEEKSRTFETKHQVEIEASSSFPGLSPSVRVYVGILWKCFTESCYRMEFSQKNQEGGFLVMNLGQTQKQHSKVFREAFWGNFGSRRLCQRVMSSKEKLRPGFPEDHKPIY